MKASRANVLTAAGLLALLAAVTLSAPRWSSLLVRSLPDAEDGGAPAASDAAPAAEETGAVERQINVKLFFQAADRRGLAIEERAVAFSSDLARQLHSVVEELVEGSRGGLGAILAPETRVLHVFVSARGVAYVDLSREATAGLPGGSEAELLTVYSVVNSLAANFPAIQRVQILIEDRPVATLGGHVDLTRPLRPDMTLLAGAPLTPVASGGTP
ncbi:MAG TPA: GerMN domain-containing protein [Vicinamibacteria bacterium]|nr:GerMN domain-containing protein [Vicinamibacteria bacterium]